MVYIAKDSLCESGRIRIMENEYLIHVRVGLTTLANVVLGFEKMGEWGTLRSLNKIGQRVFEEVEKEFIAGIREEGKEEIHETEEAIDYLRKTMKLDMDSTSVNKRAIFRTQRRASTEAQRQEGRDTTGRKIFTGERTPEEIAEAVNEASQRLSENQRRFFASQSNPGEAIHEKKPPKKALSPDDLAYMREQSQNLPGLHPAPRGAEEVDYIDSETPEEKLRRFQKRSARRLEEEYGQR
jgi:hypothetical protein